MSSPSNPDSRSLDASNCDSPSFDHTNFDQETFQKLLASAFAVQESQIDPQSLAAIVEVQRALAGGKLELDGAMARIVESARSVASAAGVAIALLQAGRLTYRAGSGTSAACIGRQVTASFTVSSDGKNVREILRVENAHTDKRIEADICRQFDADALLILPIYHDGALAGVLDVRFSEAHRFLDPEVRTYRLMAAQIGAALAQAAQPQSTNLATEPRTIPADIVPADIVSANIEEFEPADENFVPVPDFMMLPENEHSLYARCRVVLADIAELPLFKQSSSLATSLAQRARRFTWPHRPRNWSLAKVNLSPAVQRSAAFATVLKRRAKNFSRPNFPRNFSFAAIAKSPGVQRSALFAATLAQQARSLTWTRRRLQLVFLAVPVVLAFTAAIAYRNHHSTTSSEPAALPPSPAINQHLVVLKPRPGKRASAKITPSKVSLPGKSSLRRVRSGPNEVEYIGDDVTVRLFTDKPAVKRSPAPHGRIAHIGSDVTVRYFAPTPATTKPDAR